MISPIRISRFVGSGFSFSADSLSQGKQRGMGAVIRGSNHFTPTGFVSADGYFL